MRTGSVMLHFEHIFLKVVHFFRDRVLFLYVFCLNFQMRRVSIIFLIYSIVLAAFSCGLQAQTTDGNRLISAVSDYNDGRYDNASKILDEILADSETNDAAWYYRGLCAIAENDGRLAERCFKKAVGLDGENFWYRYRLADLYVVLSELDMAVSLYEKLLEDFPKKSELYFDMMDLYSSLGEYEKALETIDEIETVFGMTEYMAMSRFGILMRMQKQEEAYKSLEQYNSRYSSPYVLSTLAEHQLSMYNDSTALAYYDEALELAPDYTPALLGKAETFRMTRKYDKYFDVLNEYVANPGEMVQPKTEYLMAVVQRMDSKFLQTFMPKMDKVVETVLDVHPGDSSALRLAGSYYYSTDRKDIAKDKFSRNVQANPGSLLANADYVEFLMYAGEWETLAEEGRKSYGRFPGETAFLEMASVGDYNLKRYDAVLDICDEILEVAPGDSSRILRAWSTKGDVYHLLGEVRKSYKAYENALKVNPDYVYVLNNYSYYLSLEKKNLKKAYAMSRKAIEAEPDNATYLDTFGWILYLMGRAEEAKPYFKHAMLYGGKESAVILDHYAEVLFALGEYDLAMVYWNNALRKNDGEIEDLEERVKLRKQQMRERK